MNYVFSYHARPPRPLWKAVVYETLRLVRLVVLLAVMVGIALMLNYKQVFKDEANWKHPNFGIVADFISGLGENSDGIVKVKLPPSK